MMQKINLHLCICHFSIYFVEKPRYSFGYACVFASSIKKDFGIKTRFIFYTLLSKIINDLLQIGFACFVHLKLLV